MNRTDATTADLLALAAQIEAADGPSRELDRDIALTLGLYPYTTELGCFHDPATACGEGETWSPPTYTASIDVALTLVPVEYRDSWCFAADGPRTYGRPVAYLGFSWWGDGDSDLFGCATTPALAISAAALKARADAS